MASPFLNVDSDASVWRAAAEIASGASEGWWILDQNHSFFSEEGPYFGIVHGELISQEGVLALNLGIDTGEGHEVYSFKFSGAEAKLVFEDGGFRAEKASKIALELLYHFPEDTVRLKLREALENELTKFNKENGLSKRLLWNKI